VRRRFFELAAAGLAPIASEALQLIASLYPCREQIHGHSAEARRAVRQEKSRPILQNFEPWLRAKLGLISQKTKPAEAIRYALYRWDGLCHFVEDGLVEIAALYQHYSVICDVRRNKLFSRSKSIFYALQ
jgi:transposase